MNETENFLKNQLSIDQFNIFYLSQQRVVNCLFKMAVQNWLKSSNEKFWLFRRKKDCSIKSYKIQKMKISDESIASHEAIVEIDYR